MEAWEQKMQDSIDADTQARLQLMAARAEIKEQLAEVAARISATQTKLEQSRAHGGPGHWVSDE